MDDNKFHNISDEDIRDAVRKEISKSNRTTTCIAMIISILLFVGAFFLVFLDIKICSAFITAINTASLLSAFFGFLLFAFIAIIQLFMVIFGIALIASTRY